MPPVVVCEDVPLVAPKTSKIATVSTVARFFWGATDILRATVPSIVFVGGFAALVAYGYHSNDDLKKTMDAAATDSNTAVTAVMTTLSFVIALRQSAAMDSNKASIDQYNGICGECVSVAIYLRAFLSSNGRFSADGACRVTHIEMLLRSLPPIVKYTYRRERGVTLQSSKLPLAMSSRLKQRIDQLTAAGVPELHGCTILLFEAVDLEVAQGNLFHEIVPVLAKHVDKAYDSEGIIALNATYDYPYAVEYMMMLLFVLYFFLLVVTDLVPGAGYEAVWLVACVVAGLVGVYNVAERYRNPFNVHSSNAGQTPYISQALRETDATLHAIFRRMEARSATAIAPRRMFPAKA